MKLRILLTVWFVGILVVEVDAQMLTERPLAAGGDPTGIWEADGIPIQAYAPPEALAAISTLVFGGSATGQLTLSSTGSYEADYILTATVSLSLPGLPIMVDVADTMRNQGTYQIQGTTLILTPATTPELADTMGFTAIGDTLKLIQSIPLGEFESLATGIIPPDDPPLGVLILGKIGEPDSPGVVITADFNGDSSVDFQDFLLFAGAFGTREGDVAFGAKFDLSGNGEVDFADFLNFVGQFGM